MATIWWYWARLNGKDLEKVLFPIERWLRVGQESNLHVPNTFRAKVKNNDPDAGGDWDRHDVCYGT